MYSYGFLRSLEWVSTFFHDFLNIPTVLALTGHLEDGHLYLDYRTTSRTVPGSVDSGGGAFVKRNIITYITREIATITSRRPLKSEMVNL